MNLSALDHIQILRDVQLESVASLLDGCLVRKLVADEVLLSIGDLNRTMFILLEGRLRVHLEAVDAEVLRMIEAGDSVGELSVIEGRPVSAYVVAAESCTVLAVDERTFWSLVERSPAFSKNLLLSMADRLRRNSSNIVNQSQLRRQFEREALYDGLTGLRNRRWLNEHLPRFVEHALTACEPLSLLVIDIDHFKKFNDTYGHAAGDYVLANVARSIEQSIRPTDRAARYGGEELVVLLPNADPARALAVGEHVCRSIAAAENPPLDGQALPHATVSIGVSTVRKGDDPGALVARADTALYQAKHAGRNRVVGSL